MRFADEEDWRATEAKFKDWPKPTSRNELSNFLGAIAMSATALLGQPDRDVARRGYSPSAGVEGKDVTALNSE